MGGSAGERVKRRRVFYVPGYDPFHPRRYRELYRKEAAAQAAVSGYRLSLSPAGQGARYGWRVTASMEGARVVEINAGGVPVCRPLKETYADNMLLVGDAARVVNPLTGGGIATAIESGRYAGITAAQAIAEGRTDKDALSKYQDIWKDSFGKRLEMFYKAQQVLTSMSDSELDDSARALEKCDFESINEMEILKAVAKTNMKLLLKFKTFLT